MYANIVCVIARDVWGFPCNIPEAKESSGTQIKPNVAMGPCGLDPGPERKENKMESTIINQAVQYAGYKFSAYCGQVLVPMAKQDLKLAAFDLDDPQAREFFSEYFQYNRWSIGQRFGRKTDRWKTQVVILTVLEDVQAGTS